MAATSSYLGDTPMGFDDTFDMSDFIHIDQDFHAPARSPPNKMMPRSASNVARQNSILATDMSDHHFQGPSHDYSQFKQQTGLPSGVMANLNASGDPYTVSSYASPQFSGYPQDSDFETQSLPYYDPNAYGTGDFIDPSVMDAQDELPAATRAWPGMHSHQAQQAKAAAMAAQQRQQQQQQQQQQQLPRAPQLPSNFNTPYTQSAAAEPSESQPEVDSGMNDQISRLLNQMRQNSNASSGADEDNNDSSFSKMGREEEDMDEDERLLASEEGKKLTSKERRQLRNKVSARAFRSRRKEYIGQLEGEVAAKTNECNEIKARNRALTEQNSQLSQFARMLLNHPSFATFMAEMSNDPSSLSQQMALATKDEKPVPQEINRALQQPQHAPMNEVHVGMSMIPETNLDFSVLNLGAQEPRIFSVLELPQGPSMEAYQSSVLSGKAPSSIESEELPAKVEMPSFEHVGAAQTSASISMKLKFTEAELNDPSFALFIESPRSASSTTPVTISNAGNLFHGSLSGKSPISISLKVVQSDDACIRNIDCLFASVEAASQGVSSLMADLLR